VSDEHVAGDNNLLVVDEHDQKGTTTDATSVNSNFNLSAAQFFWQVRDAFTAAHANLAFV
jgi:hypothetical protein